MMEPSIFDAIASRVAASEPLTADDIEALTTTRDLVRLGALADDRRRARSGDEVTFVRVFEVPLEGRDDVAVPSGAGEVRLHGRPATAEAAVAATTELAARVGAIPLSAFALEDLVALCDRDASAFDRLMGQLRDGGVSRISEVAVDARLESDWPRHAADAGVPVARVVVRSAEAAGSDAVRDVAGWSESVCIDAFAPLPQAQSDTPSTGYDDVRQVALARLLVDNIPSIQVDWRLYGPKLAQVALTFGANDVDGISPVDSLALGRRRAPLAEITQNIRAAGLVPVERNGRFDRVS